MDGKRVIVGLGNSGVSFIDTRHNVGFLAIDRLAEYIRCDNQWKKTAGAFIINISQDTTSIILIKPSQGMNLSGRVLKKLSRSEKFELSEIIVLHDDVEVRLGDWKLKFKGSAGGHNGVKDIINNFYCDVFLRVRIGVGRPSNILEREIADYVLSAFEDGERYLVESVINDVSSKLLESLFKK